MTARQPAPTGANSSPHGEHEVLGLTQKQFLREPLMTNGTDSSPHVRGFFLNSAGTETGFDLLGFAL